MRFLPLLLLVGCPDPSKSTEDTSQSDTADTAADTADTGPDLVGECETTPCGGDPTGSWTLTSTCFDDAPTAFGKCDGTTIRLTDISLEATLVLNADGTYQNTVSSGTFTTTIAVPAVCNTTTVCTDVQATLPTGATCTDDGSGGCTCDSVSPWSPSDDTGAWSAADTTLTLDENGAPFCTDSDDLWVDLTGAGFIPLQTIYSR